MTGSRELPEHAARNRTAWDRWAPDWVAAGERNWDEEPSWGIWGIRESELRMLEGVAGLDAIELGCGTGYVSGWMARLGARPVGIDNSPRQLETALRLQTQHGFDFPLLLGNAETVPLPDESFDFAISEYGAATWADPYLWIREASRLLRPNGRLVFLTGGYLEILCEPELMGEATSEKLLRAQFGQYRYEWPDDESVEFHLAHGEMIRLLHRSGFEVDDLVEIQAPEDVKTRRTFVSHDWARRWPSEEIWKARKTGRHQKNAG